MAHKPVTREYTIPAGGSVSLATIFGRAGNTWIGWVTVRAGRDNMEDVYWADEDGSRGGYLGPAEAATMNFGEGQALIQNIVFTGQANDTIFVTTGIDRYYFEHEE